MQRNVATYLVCLALSGIGAVSAHAQDDIESGATQPTSFQASGNSSGEASSSTRASFRSDAPSSGGVRLGIQLRLDALTMLGPVDSTTGVAGIGSGVIGRRLLVPFVAPGVRLLDDKLFIGAGLGLHGWSAEDPAGNETSRSGFGLSPLATFDVIRDSAAALHLMGALHLASLGESETCGNPPGPDTNECVDNNDDVFGIGLTLGAGVRGLLLPGLSLGAEFGWGFLSLSADNDNSVFVHGLFGALVLEASVGL